MHNIDLFHNRWHELKFWSHTKSLSWILSDFQMCNLRLIYLHVFLLIHLQRMSMLRHTHNIDSFHCQWHELKIWTKSLSWISLDSQMCNLRLKYLHALLKKIKYVIIETHNTESFHCQSIKLTMWSAMKRVSWTNTFSHVQFDVKISAYFSLEMYAYIKTYTQYWSIS